MDKTLFLTLTICACVIETVFTPFFLHYQRPGICLKSFICKMICASMFLTVGILAYVYTGNTSEFAKFLLRPLFLRSTRPRVPRIPFQGSF